MNKKKSELEDLKRRLQKAEKIQDFNEQSELELELAEEFKEKDPFSAIQYYERALKSSKRAQNNRNIILAYRNLGEIHISRAEDEDEYKRALRYFKLQLEHAQEVNDHGLAQLAYHTLAQNYAAEAQNFGIESINITKALIHARNCLTYLNKYQDIIDKDKAVKTDEDSARRRAGINSVLADIYTKFGAIKKAQDHINASIEYALKNSERTEHVFLFLCYLVKIDLLHGKACLELIESARSYATKNKIKENRDVLERRFHMQSITCHPTDTARLCDVTEFFLKQHGSREKGGVEFVESTLKFLCLLVNFKKRLADTVTNSDRSLLYEELGDCACNAELFELGLGYYQEMLRYSENEKNKERVYLACSSIVETARNLHNYNLAQQRQIQALNLARDLYSEKRDKIFLEECELFFLNVRHGYNGAANKDEQYQKFLSILQKCDTSRKKALVLDEFVMFLAFHGDVKELQRWSEELEIASRLRDSEPETSTDQGEEEERPRLKTSELYTLREFVSKIRNKKEREDVTWRNNKGETRLHEAAKVNNPDEVKKLIDSGQNVNAKDYGGWTPLMEAVSHGHLANVRILCQNKADVNVASTEGLVDEDGNVGPNGITPLMDACATGKCLIARMLLRFNADVNLRNEHDETASDLLHSYFEANREQLSPQDVSMCQHLMSELEKKTKKRLATSNPKEGTSQENMKRFCNGHNFSV